MDQIHHLRSIDLNLLVVLDALLSERHVTRAGRLVALSQSATSNALERLRDLFDDALLERSGGSMVLTPLAESLKPRLDALLANISTVVGTRVDLTTLSQTIRWSIADYGIALLAPKLIASLQKTAPGLNLVAIPWAGADQAIGRVTEGELDFVVTVLSQGSTGLRWEKAFTEKSVVVMRRGHPASRRFTMKAWLAYPHIVVSGRGENTEALDAVLIAHGQSRRVGMVVPSFLAVPPIVAQSDLIALVPEGLLETGPYPKLITRKPPVPVPTFDVGVAWHSRRDNDVATMHVVRSLIEIAHRL